MLRPIGFLGRLASAVAESWCRATRFAPQPARQPIEIATAHQVMRHWRVAAHV